MDEQKIRAAIDQHWAASAAGDQVGEHEIYHDDVVCEYPQSGEIIHGHQNLQALRSHHPGKPSDFTVRRIVGEGDLWVTEYQIDYGGKRALTVSIMEFRDGRVSRETQYFANSFEAPAWRAQWVGGR
jgi:ketosteroid isomerase-like protein